MHGRFRRLAAALLTVACVASLALPAAAYEERRESEMAMQTLSPIADLMVLRPMGLVAMAVGTVLFVVPVAPLALLTRPDGVPVAFTHLVANPARYVWADPLGTH